LQGFSGEESYWQSGTGDDGNKPDAGQAPASETIGDISQGQPPAVDVETFFEENARQEGVVSLPSGLQYRVLKNGNGSGKSPGVTDTVTLKYRGTLPDGREISRSEEATRYRLGEVLPAWQEALQQMEEGAQWELYVPPSLARRGGTRKRNLLDGQPVIYQVELVSINQTGDTPAKP
jgi:FKBP-type peptidyl-prolyl cis-trans isomerase FklB